jgi:hypothetical protein
MEGTQEALSRQRGRGVHNLSAQRRKQRNVCFRASNGPEIREVKARWLDSKDASRKANGTQVKRPIHENWIGARSRNLARVSGDQEALFRRWNRGSIHTEDAVGRHRREAIESSVVRITSMCRTARLIRRDGNQRKLRKFAPIRCDHKETSAMSHLDGCGSLVQEDGDQGALIRPERFRGSLQTLASR